MQFVKFFVWIFCLVPFLVSCGDYKKSDCNSDCTPRKLSTPYYNLASYGKPDLLGVTLKGLKDYLVISKIVTAESMKEFDEKDTNSPKYIKLERSSMIIIKPSPNPNKLKSIDYIFPKCRKINKKDFDHILQISNFFVHEKYEMNKLFHFSFKDEEISTNQLKLENGLILEASCDPMDHLGQFHIYRE